MGFCFLFCFFSLGDFTLVSKKHVKREEIEDKVTQFGFFNIFSFLTLCVIFVLKIICLVVLFRLFGLLELAVELVCEFLILCIVKQWQIWFALSWIYAAIDVFYGDAWMDVHVDGFDLHFIYIYIYIYSWKLWNFHQWLLLSSLLLSPLVFMATIMMMAATLATTVFQIFV